MTLARSLSELFTHTHTSLPRHEPRRATRALRIASAPPAGRQSPSDRARERSHAGFFFSPANPADPAAVIPHHAGSENDAGSRNTEISVFRDWKPYPRASNIKLSVGETWRSQIHSAVLNRLPL